MTDESVFRLFAIISLVLNLPIGLYHRIRSQATREKLARKEEGILIMVGLRLCGLFALISLAAYLINPSWMIWSSVAFPYGCVGSVGVWRCLRSRRSSSGRFTAWART